MAPSWMTGSNLSKAIAAPAPLKSAIISTSTFPLGAIQPVTSELIQMMKVLHFIIRYSLTIPRTLKLKYVMLWYLCLPLIIPSPNIHPLPLRVSLAVKSFSTTTITSITITRIQFHVATNE
jgi:hypothetical protein